MSGGEVVVIFVVALLVFGPKRLPELGRTIGKFMREINRSMQDVKDQINAETAAPQESKDQPQTVSTEGVPPEEKPDSKEGTDVSILQANQEDASEILTLQRVAYQTEVLVYGDWNIPPLTQTLAQLESEFGSKVFLKAVETNKIVGSVRASLDGNKCGIDRLIVHPDYRRRGIGRELMLKIETFFPDAERFELFTGSKSADNIRLYEKLGYRICREEDLSEKVRIVFMEKQR